MAPTSNFSGVGDCDNIAFDVVDEKCSLTECEQLPDAWSRDAPPENIDGRCPYTGEDSWVESEDIGCDDPCLDQSNCGECVDKDCVWSFENQNCRSACSFAEKCLIMPSVDIGMGSTELYEELAPSTTTTSTTTTVIIPPGTTTETKPTAPVCTGANPGERCFTDTGFPGCCDSKYDVCLLLRNYKCKR